MDSGELVEYNVTDGIAEITLNRPRVLNAMNDESVLALRQVLLRLDDDEQARVAVVHGRGRAFCSGADVHQRFLRTREELERLGNPQARGAHIGQTLFGMTNWKPVICAVHGYVLGAGLHFALQADMIVAEAGTKFQVTEVPRGLDGGAFWQLMTWMGAGAFATEVTVTGRFFTAEEAVTHGILTEVTPAGDYLTQARGLARTLADNPPLAVRELVRVRRAAIQRIELEHEAVGARGLHLTADFRESSRAFAEKRKPGPFRGE
jgi:enoyl-CoA hydratase/carnithine racemase